MKTRHIIWALTLSIPLLSCQKQETAAGGMLSLDVLTENLETTRSTPINTLADFKSNVGFFKVGVYDGSTNSLISAAPTCAYLSGNDYKMNKSYYWNPTKELDIYTVAPEPSAGTDPTGLSSYSPAPASNKVTFAYTIASSAPSAMKDLMIGRFRGKSDTGAATIKFYHALSALTFYTGNLIDMKINSITLENIYGSGNCEASYSSASGTVPTIGWTGQGTPTSYTLSLSPAIDFKFLGAEKAIAKDENTFMVIPQTPGSTAKLKLNVKLQETATVQKDVDIYASLGTYTWEAGKMYKYKVDYDKQGMISISSIEVNDWDSTPGTNSLDLDK